MYSVTTPHPFFVRNLLDLITALDNIDLVHAATTINADRPYMLQIRNEDVDSNDSELEWSAVDYGNLESYARAGDVIFFYAGDRPMQILDQRTDEWKDFNLPELLVSNSTDSITVSEVEINTVDGEHRANRYYGEIGRVVDITALVPSNEYVTL